MTSPAECGKWEVILDKSEMIQWKRNVEIQTRNLKQRNLSFFFLLQHLTCAEKLTASQIDLPNDMETRK